MDHVSHGAERLHLKQAGLKGCGKDPGQENGNPEESRAREERIKLYSCRPEAWLFVVKLEEGILSLLLKEHLLLLFPSPGSSLVCRRKGQCQHIIPAK